MIISIELYVVLMICSFLGILLSIGAIILGSISYLTVTGLKNSTHNVQYVPIDPEVDKENEKWATSQAAINKEENLYRDELEANMPLFSTDKEEREILSL